MLLRIYLVHIINNFANLWYWFHVFIFACILEQGQKMKIVTCYFIYTVMKVLLNIYIHCSVVHSYGFPVRLRLHHHSQHTHSGNLQSTDRDQCRQVRLFETDNGC